MVEYRVLLFALIVFLGFNAWVKRQNTEAIEENTRLRKMELCE